ncbi:MAG TPA: S1C family serine protease [Actinomycetota bacterium]|nr:S1C family serine protease [Actinomycetota bacterium]
MKRSLVPMMAVAALAVTACTRTVIERVPARSSPMFVDVGATDPSLDPVVRAVEAVRPAVVNVTTNLFHPDPVVGESGRGVGTGFVIRSDGIVVTNFHVVERAQRITVGRAGGRHQHRRGWSERDDHRDPGRQPAPAGMSGVGRTPGVSSRA